MLRNAAGNSGSFRESHERLGSFAMAFSFSVSYAVWDSRILLQAHLNAGISTNQQGDAKSVAEIRPPR